MTAPTTPPTAVPSDAMLSRANEIASMARPEYFNRVRAMVLALAAAPQAAPVPIQGGMSNPELFAAWERKLPGLKPTDEQISAFAIGIEVGYALATQPAPTAEPVAWWRKRADEIEAQAALSGSAAAMACYTQMRGLLQAATTPQPAQQADQRDAERYRWLRHGDNDDLVLQRGPVDPSFVYLPRNAKLDEMIDAAIAATKGEA